MAIRLDEIEFPGGHRAEYEIVEHPGAVAMVVLTADGEVVLVRQYRAAVEADLLEIPAGTMEPGETPERCAERELAEEVGRAAGRWERLSSFYPSPGILSEMLHVFLARDLRPAVAASEEVDLRVETMALQEARRRIDSGEIRDAKSVIGIALACERLGTPG
ncbi:MAG TPA: NUDIX hydrolase [bacterium]|nr:NUDIX hydrolase [bacterium]